MIGLVLVWKLKDTYKALFEVDTQTMAAAPNSVGTDMRSIMNALERFVRVQSDAALRQVAGQYAYDDEDKTTVSTDCQSDNLTLRGGGNEINDQLEEKLNERLALAGIRWSRPASTIWLMLLRLLPSCYAASRLLPSSLPVKRLSRVLYQW
jgi:hypothetical protein